MEKKPFICKSLLLYILLTFILACSNQQQTASIPKEYYEISDKIEALEREMKATISLQYALESYDAKKAMYKEIELRNTQLKNRRKGYPVGPALPRGLNRKQKIYVLRRNYSLISDAKRNLEIKRNSFLKNS